MRSTSRLGPVARRYAVRGGECHSMATVRIHSKENTVGPHLAMGKLQREKGQKFLNRWLGL